MCRMGPIMGAFVGPNVGLSKFGNLIIRKISEEADEGHASKSTEETIAKIEEYNKNKVPYDTLGRKVIVGSLDADKMYPSLKAVPSAKGIRVMTEESEIVFKEFDMDVVSKFLGERLTTEEIKHEGMEEIVYIR